MMKTVTAGIVALSGALGACVEGPQLDEQSESTQDNLSPPPWETLPACRYITGGGHVISEHVSIHLMFWGNTFWNGYGAAYRADIEASWDFLGNHHAVINSLQQYGVGLNSVVGPSVVDGEPSASVDDSQAWRFAYDHLPRIGLSKLLTPFDVFVVYLPPGVTSTVDAANGTDGHHWTEGSPYVEPVPGVTIPWHDGSAGMDLDGVTVASVRGVLDAAAHPDLAEMGSREVVEPCDSLGRYRLNGYLVPRVYSNRECGCVTTVGLGRGMKDFNRDGRPDVLWHNRNTGDLAVWSLGADYKVVSSGYLSAKLTGTQWNARGTGDFNGDRNPDVVWHNLSTGEIAIWYMNGTTVSSSAIVDRSVTGTAWQLRGTGDFDGDGALDMVWHNASTGEVLVWYLDGSAHVARSVIVERRSIGASPILAGTGDFNGDGRTDLLWHNPTTGALTVWMMKRDGSSESVRGTAVLDATYVGNDWHLMGTQDFDNDGLVDLLWHNPVTGQVSVWTMSGFKVTGYPLVDWTLAYPWRIISH